MWFAFGILGIIIVLGISLSIQNLNDDAAREERLRKRRAERKARKRLW